MSAGLLQKLRGLKSRAVRMAGPLGLYAIARGLTRSEPRILMYHRFGTKGTPPGVPVDVFRQQLSMLQSRFRIITLRELAERIRADAVEPNLAVITVDDGYEDFHRVAFPTLREAGVPATFFVTTGFVDGDLWLWPDVIESLLENTPVAEPDLGGFGVNAQVDTTRPSGRASAWGELIGHFLDLDTGERQSQLQHLASVLEISCPASPDAGHAPSSWDDIREMSRSGIEIGAHTVTHPRLTRESDRSLESEIAGSKARLEEQIDGEVTSFCYPNGAPADYDDRVAAAVRDAGFKCAVVAHFDGIRGDIYRLRRLGVGDDMFQYRKSLAGIEHVGRRWLKPDLAGI